MAPASPSSPHLPAFAGLSPRFGFVLVRRLIEDWGRDVRLVEPEIQGTVAQALDSEGRIVCVAIKQPKPIVVDARDSKGPDPAVSIAIEQSKGSVGDARESEGPAPAVSIAIEQSKGSVGDARESEAPAPAVSIAIKKQPRRRVGDARVSERPAPAELPCFLAKVDSRSPPAAPHLVTPDLVVATMGDQVLLLIDGDLFLYVLENQLPILLALPSYPAAAPHSLRALDWWNHRRTTGIASVDEDTVAVVSLRPPKLESTEWGGLLRWSSSSSTGAWEHKPIISVSGNMRPEHVDTTVALGGSGKVCWGDFTRGIMLVGVFDEDPSTQFIPFPVSMKGHRKNTLSFVNGRLTLVAARKKPSLAYELLVFELDMDSAAWAQRAAIDIPWASHFSPLFPTPNAQDPRLLYFLENARHGGCCRLHGINTKAKRLMRSREHVPFTCSPEEISHTAPWVTMQLRTTTEGYPLSKRQRDAIDS